MTAEIRQLVDRVVVAVWAEEVSPWVRRTIPAHLARVEAAGADVHVVVSVLPESRASGLLTRAEKRGGAQPA